MDAWGLTDVGLIRPQNQDSFLIELLPETGQALCVVCDGMGGARGGNVASGLASAVFIEEARRRLRPELKPQKMESLLQEAVNAANSAVWRKSHESADYTGMGTTLVALLSSGDRIAVINVGDSRAYLISSKGISLITRDHSLVADMVRRGELTPEEARVHPNRNLITRALGTGQSVKGDFFSMDLRPGENILLCTDGLSNMLSDQEILFDVIHGGEKSLCCRRLIDIALKRGAPDNVTVVLFEK
ncbi:MAG: Stp1/IreP family PP2C-type Ser/Thr phosphatase [Oscillospiraceae bacterium]|jgi:serine/threonine protein phosphatase PrpC